MKEVQKEGRKQMRKSDKYDSREKEGKNSGNKEMIEGKRQEVREEGHWD